MFRKLIINNKIFNFILVLIAILSFGQLFLQNQVSTMPIFNLIEKDNILEEDLNGDKKTDTIAIKHTTQGLIAQVNLNKNKTYSLDYNSTLPTLGEYSSYWPTRISTLDISRDNSKEIFLQSSFHNKAVQNIFTWDGSKYVNLFSSTGNLLGFIDSGNSKTPKVIIGNFHSGNMDLQGYMYNKGTLKEFTDTTPLTLAGEDTISNLITLVQSLPNPYISVPNYFYSQISGSDLESLFRLANGSNTFTFQDGYFIDLAWNENGVITCENWILNFKAMNTSNPSQVSNMTINLMINKYNDEDFPYKITSFNIYQ